jgi:YD repeat-containing protein
MPMMVSLASSAFQTVCRFEKRGEKMKMPNSFSKKILSGALAFAGLFACTSPTAAQEGPPPLDAIPPSPAADYATSKGGVDMRTGQYTYSKTDLAMSGPGAISLVRNAGSEIRYALKPMGQFSHNWHIYISYKPTKNGTASFSVQGSRGTSFAQTLNSNNFSARSADSRAELKAIPTGSSPSDRYFVYIAGDGAKITFRPQVNNTDKANRGEILGGKSFYASMIEEPDGTTFTLTYDEPTSSNPAFLRRVTSNTGYVLIFEYVTNAVDKFVSKACLFNAAVDVVPTSNSCSSSTYKTSYTYGSNGYMTTAVDTTNQTWTYSSTFNPAAWSTAVSNDGVNATYTWTDTFFYPGQSTPYLTNNHFRNIFYQNVSSQTFSEGPTYSYSWTIVEHSEQAMEVVGGYAFDADGKSVRVGYQAMRRPGYEYGDSYIISQGPSSIKDELDRYLTASYCIPITIFGNPGCAAVPARYWKFPDGNQTDYAYDVRGNVLSTTQKAKPGSSDPDITRSFTYNCAQPAACSKPVTITDALGRVTNNQYSTVHGGLLKTTLPADPNGIRPETRYTYAQRYAWKKSGGGFAISTPPVWVLISEEYCQTSAADTNGNCAAGSADEIVTTYEYEVGSSSKGSNLRLLGTAITADGQTLRTCMTYDKWGRAISETQPNANLTSCS